jgi:hypothetical protein
VTVCVGGVKLENSPESLHALVRLVVATVEQPEDIPDPWIIRSLHRSMLQCRHCLWQPLKVQQRNAPIQLRNGKRSIKSVSLAKLIDGLLQELLIHQSGANVIQANRFTVSTTFCASHPLKRIAEQQKNN